MTEGDGSGEGDCPAVEKFELAGLLLGSGLLIGTAASWGRMVVALAGAAAAPPVRVPAFEFVVVVVPARAFAPIGVTTVELLPEPPSPPAAPPVTPPV